MLVLSDKTFLLLLLRLVACWRDLFLVMNSRLEISNVFTISLCEIVSVDGELETVTVLIESARTVVLWKTLLLWKILLLSL